MNKWQQLKVQINPTQHRFIICESSTDVAREFEEILNGKPLTLDHIDSLGWELVTVCKNSLYYKRQIES